MQVTFPTDWSFTSDVDLCRQAEQLIFGDDLRARLGEDRFINCLRYAVRSTGCTCDEDCEACNGPEYITCDCEENEGDCSNCEECRNYKDAYFRWNGREHLLDFGYATVWRDQNSSLMRFWESREGKPWHADLDAYVEEYRENPRNLDRPEFFWTVFERMRELGYCVYFHPEHGELGVMHQRSADGVFRKGMDQYTFLRACVEAINEHEMNTQAGDR